MPPDDIFFAIRTQMMDRFMASHMPEEYGEFIQGMADVAIEAARSAHNTALERLAFDRVETQALKDECDRRVDAVIADAAATKEKITKGWEREVKVRDAVITCYEQFIIKLCRRGIE
jgi:hypothetical protein